MRVTAAVAFAAGLAMLPTIVRPTEAAWRESSFGSSTFTAATVLPPLNLTCTGSLLSNTVTFNWANPSGGALRTSYAWAITGAFARTGTLGPAATTLAQTVPLLTVGQATFTLRALGPAASGWESSPVPTSFNILTSGAITC